MSHHTALRGLHPPFLKEKGTKRVAFVRLRLIWPKTNYVTCSFIQNDPILYEFRNLYCAHFTTTFGRFDLRTAVYNLMWTAVLIMISPKIFHISKNFTGQDIVKKAMKMTGDTRQSLDWWRWWLQKFLIGVPAKNLTHFNVDDYDDHCEVDHDFDGNEDW